MSFEGNILILFKLPLTHRGVDYSALHPITCISYGVMASLHVTDLNTMSMGKAHHGDVQIKRTIRYSSGMW